MRKNAEIYNGCLVKKKYRMRLLIIIFKTYMKPNFLSKFKRKFLSKDSLAWLTYYCLVYCKLDKYVSDEFFLKLRYRCMLGKKLDLENPKSFTEKLQWLKLHDRKEIYSMMVDKVKVKEYIKSVLGEQYVIPLLHTWKNVDEINIDKLPNQFVLKWNHDSGSVVICKDKSSFDLQSAKEKLRRGQTENGYWHGREWPYKNVQPLLFAETYMGGGNNECLTDYKFFCFHGEPKFMYISKDIANEARTDFFDMEFNRLAIRMKDPNSDILPDKPEKFEEMKKIAQLLSKDIPHVRIDFYIIDNKIYFGEFTFYHNSGFMNIQPAEWDNRIGNFINI